MNQPIEFKTTLPFITKSTMHSCAAPRCGIIAVLLVCFAFFQNGQAVNPRNFLSQHSPLVNG